MCYAFQPNFHPFMTSGSIHPAQKIQSFFASIAHRYDRANHLLSGGFDFFWRQEAARIVAATGPRRILDLATGSGDLAALLQKKCPGTVVVGADFCFPMLQIAKGKPVRLLVGADALHLPFGSDCFDCVTVAFGLRNMASWPAVLAEVLRVLRPGGTFLILDFALPTGLFGKIYRFYLHRVLPRLANLVTGESAAYEYLGDSIEKFPSGAAMEKVLQNADFTAVTGKFLTGGIVAIYTGRKKSDRA